MQLVGRAREARTESYLDLLHVDLFRGRRRHAENVARLGGPTVAANTWPPAHYA